MLLSVTPTDIQTALYELCWQVVQGNLKLDLVTSVLGDMMVHVFLACCFYLKFVVVVVGLFLFCVGCFFLFVCFFPYYHLMV